MSLLSRLFGGGSAAKSGVQAIDHKGFAIYPEPLKEGGSFRLCARIEKEVDGVQKSHTMIRADTFQSREQAEVESAGKAKVFIDQMGDKIFG